MRAVVGADYAAAISCSQISLGLLSEIVEGASSGDLITTRTFEIPACGGVLLHERTVDVLKIFREEESCVCFEGIDELVSKIDQLLADEEWRRAIAAQGREVMVAGHSWDHRVGTMLEHFCENHHRGNSGSSI
jgi:spore maturation protein CgeB